MNATANNTTSAIASAITEAIMTNIVTDDDVRMNIKTLEFVDWIVNSILRSPDVETAASTAVEFLTRMDEDAKRHGALTFELKRFGLKKPIFRRVLVCPSEERILDTFREMWEATPNIIPYIGLMSDAEKISFLARGEKYEFRVLGGIR